MILDFLQWINEKRFFTTDEDAYKYAKFVAKAYEQAPDMDKTAIHHWDALRKSSLNLYQKMLSDIDVIYTEVEIYKDAKEMADDVKNNRRMYTTLENRGHPLWSDEDYQKFRAVHDYIVHVLGNTDFSLRGELSAYNLHAQLIPNEAKPACFIEIVGKVSYVYTHGIWPPLKIAVLQGVDFDNVGRLLDKGVDYHKPQKIRKVIDTWANQEDLPGGEF